MTSIRIRWSTPADLTALRGVFARASLSNGGDREALLAHPTALVLEGDSIDKGRSRVATHTDHIVGFATIVLTEGVPDLQDLFVDPQWMRQGIGRQLVHDAAAIAAMRGARAITVTANPHALDFYDALGFVLDGEVHTPFGPGQRMHLAVEREHS